MPSRIPDHASGDTIVLGIGNTLLADEGVGVHVVNRLQAESVPDERAAFIDGGTLSFVLAGTIGDASELIVVDAAEMKASPGSVRVYEGRQMDAFLGSNRKRSVHEVGLLDLMAIAHLDGRLPARRALIAIQPACIDWSEKLSEPVARAVPQACNAARGLLARWRA